MDVPTAHATPPPDARVAGDGTGAPRERMLLAAMQTSPDAFVVIDHEDRVEWWNRAAEQLFGWSLDEAVGRLLTELVVPEQHRAAHHEGLRRRAAGGEPHLGADPVQVEAVCRDGSRILVELSVGELEWEGGPRFHAFVRDVTDREAARSALEHSETRARMVFENAPVGMLLFEVVDGGLGRVVAANPAAVAMLGYTQEQLRERSWRDITHPDDRRVDEEKVPHLLAGELEQLQHEKRYVRSDGREVWVASSATVIRALDGAPLHSIHQLLDVTERRAGAEELLRLNAELRHANAELARANAELDRFTAAVAHDLKNPLTAIGMHAELLAETEPDGVDLRRARAISRAATRMNALIEGLLDHSRAQGAGLRRESVELGPLVDDVGAELALTADRPIHVTRDDLPALPVEATLFRQVVANVIGNGIKYVAVGTDPHVHVSADEDHASGSWTLHFSDNGIGIPPESRERVFEMFHREATDYPGTGIGLATCRRIVERHGGRIWADGGPEGGTVVHVQVPTHDTTGP
ncbi:PAS domain S-box-containing protein [Nocardioides cavernae]|uniref:Sensor-like histidine kinase SenX3 n=1 Tax=Nocardioides cavernae TaxID=1921566 RepID=A0A7Y9H5J7_9ACTN|nr:PAS domain-containing sensor histidine kinase [Nocardioides cavernae]NYE38118.1 PAS domain S-box-containing protein [Nocardioides cavernae]